MTTRPTSGDRISAPCACYALLHGAVELERVGLPTDRSLTTRMDIDLYHLGKCVFWGFITYPRDTEMLVYNAFQVAHMSRHRADLLSGLWAANRPT